jgi:3-hydroxyisobutyrate dehydrogenase
MSLGTALGEKYNSPLPLAKAAELIYEAVIETQPELAKKDFSSVYVSLRDLARQADEVQAAAEAEAKASKEEA